MAQPAWEIVDQIKAKINQIQALRAKREMLVTTYDDRIKQMTTELAAYMQSAGIPKVNTDTAQAFSRKVKDVEVTDWAKVFYFVEKHQAYDLLQRRLHVTAALARIKAGEDIPGLVKKEDRIEFVVRALPKKGEKDDSEHES